MYLYALLIVLVSSVQGQWQNPPNNDNYSDFTAATIWPLYSPQYISWSVNVLDYVVGAYGTQNTSQVYAPDWIYNSSVGSPFASTDGNSTTFLWIVSNLGMPIDSTTYWFTISPQNDTSSTIWLSADFNISAPLPQSTSSASAGPATSIVATAEPPSSTSPTQTPAPTHKDDRARNLGLGVGVGLGLPVLAVCMIAGVWIGRRAFQKQGSGDRGGERESQLMDTAVARGVVELQQGETKRPFVGLSASDTA